MTHKRNNDPNKILFSKQILPKNATSKSILLLSCESLCAHKLKGIQLVFNIVQLSYRITSSYLP